MPMEIINTNIEETLAEARVEEVTIEPDSLKKHIVDKVKQSFGLETELEPGMADVELANAGKAKFVIRAALPRWQGGGAAEQDALAKACANAISLAREFGFRTLAIPQLGEKSGYPEELAQRTVKAIISVALVNDDIKILLVQ